MLLNESGRHKSQRIIGRWKNQGVVEGFGDTDETYSDLQDEPVTIAIEVLVLSCIAVWIAMQFVHACCLSLFLQFQRLG
jgi:hypothetical protein